MKPTKKKLSLSRETVRSLSPREMRAAAGGIPMGTHVCASTGLTCKQSTILSCATAGSDLCLASIVAC